MTDFKNRKGGHGARKSMTVKYLPSLGKVAHLFIPKLKKGLKADGENSILVVFRKLSVVLALFRSKISKKGIL